MLTSSQSIYDWLKRIPQDIEAMTNLVRRDSNAKLRSYKNKFAGERCFVVGNGPSLNNMDMSKLSDEYTFGMNRIFLMFP